MKKAAVLVGIILAVFFTGPILAQNINLQYSTYLGGSWQYDRGQSIAVDSDGCAYVTGNIVSADFPTINAYQASRSTGGNLNDAFITKFSPSGSSLVYSTYLGGSQDDGGNAISVDTMGSAYVTGWTTSTDNFPIVNAYQPVSNEESWGNDAFVTKFSSSGSFLIFSTITFIDKNI